jgi:hypothetical protein
LLAATTINVVLSIICKCHSMHPHM